MEEESNSSEWAMTSTASYAAEPHLGSASASVASAVAQPWMQAWLQTEKLLYEKVGAALSKMFAGSERKDSDGLCPVQEAWQLMA